MVPRRDAAAVSRALARSSTGRVVNPYCEHASYSPPPAWPGRGRFRRGLRALSSSSAGRRVAPSRVPIWPFVLPISIASDRRA